MDGVIEYDELAKEHLDSPWGEWGRTATLSLVALASKFVVNVMNKSKFDNKEALLEAVMERPEGVGLITVSNHTSTLDDPMLFSAMLPWSFFLSERVHKRVRWSLCAREMCYRNWFLSQFFKSGKTLPVERGAGLYQPIMTVVARAVASGDWVHVFPEGRINYSGTLSSFRWGVGKLFCDAYIQSGRTPMVLPFYHSGMGDVLPRKKRVPRPGNMVVVQVGDPVDLAQLATKCKSDTIEGQTCAWKEITAVIEKSLRDLESKTHPRNRNQLVSWQQ